MNLAVPFLRDGKNVYYHDPDTAENFGRFAAALARFLNGRGRYQAHAR
jgi:hypothetical protein